nr:YerC/YecD family TrpR-related protein [Clostridium beijerinckii]
MVIIKEKISITRGDKVGSLESKLKSKELDLFFKSILELKNIDECYKFFEDVATINEVKSLAQRLHVAKLLKGKKTYSEIAEITGASTATISRVNRCLNYGSDGYNLVLERLKDENID